jgi:hypothetical protein
MDDESDPLAHIQSLEQSFEVAAVLYKAVRAGTAVGHLVGITHADQVGGDAERLQMRYHVAPEI